MEDDLFKSVCIMVHSTKVGTGQVDSWFLKIDNSLMKTLWVLRSNPMHNIHLMRLPCPSLGRRLLYGPLLPFPIIVVVIPPAIVTVITPPIITISERVVLSWSLRRSLGFL